MPMPIEKLPNSLLSIPLYPLVLKLRRSQLPEKSRTILFSIKCSQMQFTLNLSETEQQDQCCFGATLVLHNLQQMGDRGQRCTSQLYKFCSLIRMLVYNASFVWLRDVKWWPWPNGVTSLGTGAQHNIPRQQNIPQDLFCHVLSDVLVILKGLQLNHTQRQMKQ